MKNYFNHIAQIFREYPTMRRNYKRFLLTLLIFGASFLVSKGHFESYPLAYEFFKAGQWLMLFIIVGWTFPNLFSRGPRADNTYTINNNEKTNIMKNNEKTNIMKFREELKLWEEQLRLWGAFLLILFCIAGIVHLFLWILIMPIPLVPPSKTEFMELFKYFFTYWGISFLCLVGGLILQPDFFHIVFGRHEVPEVEKSE